MAISLNPYSTVEHMLGALPQWLTPEDAKRLEAYTTYEAIYKNVPEAFKLVRQGSDANPIYLPSAMTIIEATNRFLAKNWNFVVEPDQGSPADRLNLAAALQSLFRREKIWGKFATQKRYGLIRGDQVWHVVADEGKPEGSRISVYEVDPGSYFPIADPWNPEKILGCHLVDPVEMEDGSVVIKRQTYRKTESGTISYELSWWESGYWDDRDGGKLKKAKTVPPGDDNRPVSYELPDTITALPVYHIKNNRTPGHLFGSSDLAGFETIIAAVNQTISDEDLTLALEGLGLYFTNSGPPVDDEGNETNWRLGPGWVVEGDVGSDFKRVNGVSSVEPSQRHIAQLESSMREAAGVPDIAVGQVDVSTAESGIALAFKLAPILAKNEEKELEILPVMDHMLYDLATAWLPEFEGLAGEARAVSVVGDPVPQNRETTLAEITAMLQTDPPIISVQYARQLIAEKLGYEFPEGMDAEIVAGASALASAKDPLAARVTEELRGNPDEENALAQ